MQDGASAGAAIHAEGVAGYHRGPVGAGSSGGGGGGGGGLGDIDEGEEEEEDDDDDASVITNGSHDAPATAAHPSPHHPAAAAAGYAAAGYAAAEVEAGMAPYPPHRTYHNITVPFDRHGKLFYNLKIDPDSPFRPPQHEYHSTSSSSGHHGQGQGQGQGADDVQSVASSACYTGVTSSHCCSYHSQDSAGRPGALHPPMPTQRVFVFEGSRLPRSHCPAAAAAEAATLIMDLGEGRLLLPSHYIIRNAPAGANGRAGEAPI